MAKPTDITGIKFYKLLVLYQIPGSRKSPSKVACQCECGNKTIQFKNSITSGRVKSCSCYKNELARKNHLKHGLRKHPIYSIWNAMIQRCYNPKNKSFHNYGGRGIKVCDEWKQSFYSFYLNIGNRPSAKHTLDRINNDGNYEPTNVKWSLPHEQANNTRANHWLEFDGKKITMAQASKKFGISYSKLKKRIYKGHSLHDIIADSSITVQDRLPEDHQL